MTPLNRAVILGNSTNMHVIRDKLLFISDIKPYPLGLNMGMVVGLNKLQGIRLAKIQ